MSIKRNLDQVIFEQIRDRIIKADWEQGVQLDVDELAAFFEVSRTPVLHTLKRMQTEGMLVVSGVGKYYFPKYNETQVKDICRIRLVLELEALNEIKEKHHRPDIQELWFLTRQCRRCMEHGDWAGSRRNDMEFHKKLVAASENECLIGLYTKVQGQFMVANYLQTFHSEEQQRVASDDHVLIMENLEKGDYDAASAIITEHIDTAALKIVARQRANED